MDKAPIFAANIIAPSPYTERALSSCLAVSQNGKFLAYCVGHTIVVRSLEDLTQCKVFTNHKANTTACAFTHNNVFIVSGDELGNVKIWWIDDLKIKKEFDNCLGGRVNGFGWNEENDRLLIYGGGKSYYARVITWDSGNNVGEISNHTKIILSGDFKKSRPYKVVTCGEDYVVNYHEGVPFKFKKSNKLHTNFVTGVKFSPDYNSFISVGFDKRIILYDAKTGDVVETIAEEGSNNNHTSAIVAFTWLDNETIVTGSLDRTIKVWKIKEKEVTTLISEENSEKAVEKIVAGIAHNEKYIICLTLDGKLNFWDRSTLAEKKLPDLVLDGHQNYINSIVYNTKYDNIISADTDGKIIAWDNAKGQRVLAPSTKKKVVNLALTRDEEHVVSLTSDPLVTVFEAVSGTPVSTCKLDGDALVVKALDKDNVYVLFKNKVLLVTGGAVAKEQTLSFNATALEVGRRGLFIGDLSGVVHSFGHNLVEIEKLQEHQGEITALTLSHNEEFLASGDNKKYVQMWTFVEEKLKHYTDNFCYHSSKIYDIAFSKDDSLLISGSLDRNCILWNVQTKAKVKTFEGIDGEVVTSVALVSNNTFVAGGHNCSIHVISF